MDNHLNIFTCCNGVYEDFIPLFASSALWSNPQACVEIGVPSALETRSKQANALAILEHMFPDQFLLRGAKWERDDGRRILANSIRFITEPKIKTRYVYISDIDIITLEGNILDRHLAHMKAINLPYSNRLRKLPGKLTGLHFASTDFQYPLPKLDDLLAISGMGDENLLYQIVERQLGYAPPPGSRFRPVHGIHISPNRLPEGKIVDGVRGPGWGIELFDQLWHAYRNSAIFLSIEPYLTEAAARYVSEIDRVAGPRMDKYVRFQDLAQDMD